MSRLLRRVEAAWRALVFREEPVTPLELVRIGVGLTLLALYVPVTVQLGALYGDEGWISREAVARYAGNPLTPSVLFHLGAPWSLALVHGIFLAACAAFTLGWRTHWVKWLVLAGHVSYLRRNPAIAYGVDTVLANLLFVLCLAPIGRALSLDAWRRARAGAPARLESAWGFACLRLLQLQMVIVFFFAATQKLQGDAWWHGYAVWLALTNAEYTNVPLGWLAQHFWIVNALTYTTLLVELAYPFLVWDARTRPWILAGAIALHVGMGAMMGLYAFSLVMIAGHLAFVPEPWLSAFAARARSSAAERAGDGVDVGLGVVKVKR